ncbi:Uncharacterised protein [Pragia fontium]|uniref:hypothetical protein n=1 Tax=Pragia fontium TaxID=82985 RepID=UPI000E07E0BD|nr:hypothetical protein [Pragia fontium]SUB83055.1 Uncharacterised protein [Pragia fontium]
MKKLMLIGVLGLASFEASAYERLTIGDEISNYCMQVSRNTEEREVCNLFIRKLTHLTYEIGSTDGICATVEHRKKDACVNFKNDKINAESIKQLKSW